MNAAYQTPRPRRIGGSGRWAMTGQLVDHSAMRQSRTLTDSAAGNYALSRALT